MHLSLFSLPALGLLVLFPASGPAADPAAPATAASADSFIRTPAAPPEPRLNGPRVFGAKPGHPFFYHLPATGERPITFAATGLPAGLKLDATAGNVTGAATEPGHHPVAFTATNARGKAEATVDFVIGDTIALTPPMGFNTWNFFNRNISDAKIRAAADAMVSSGLIDHGWTYINIDDCWQGGRDAAGNIQGNEKFPDLKALGDYIHSKGLKFGIYSSPGPKTCGGFAGSYGHEDQDARTYAAWGVDYVKYDLCSYGSIIGEHTRRFVMEQIPGHADEYGAAAKERDELRHVSGKDRTPEQAARLRALDEQIKTLEAAVDPEKRRQFNLAEHQRPYEVFGHSLAQVERDIVYSFCQYGDADSWKWAASLGGNSWRTTGDIQANWRSLSGIGFRQNELAPYAGPGHWNDPDMLEIGNKGLTPDECYTHMTLWSLLAAPLLIGCDMTKMDPLTVSLFSNDEVLAVNQDALGKQGTRLRQDGDTEVWIKPLANREVAVALFNRGETPAQVGVKWNELKLTTQLFFTARDLWRQKEVPTPKDGVEMTVAPHGAELLRLTRWVE